MLTQKVKIEKLIYGGAGLGFIEGKAVFVPYGVPGDILSVKITSQNKGTQWAKIEEIIEPSSHRAEPFCSLFYKCGGCLWQNIKYEKQAEFKREIVLDCLTRLAGLKDIDVNPCIASPVNRGYRHRVRLHWNTAENKLGFYEAQTHKIVPVKSCPVLSDEINSAVAQLSELLEKNPPGNLSEVQFMTGKNKEVVLNFIMKSFPRDKSFIEAYKNNLPVIGAGMSAGYDYKPLWGRDNVTFSINEINIRATSNTFFQANTALIPAMTDQVLQHIKKKKINIAVELYSGVGLFSTILASNAKKLFAIELNNQAAADAGVNLAGIKADNISILSHDAEEGLKLLLAKKIKPELIVTDPPREGMTKAVCSIIKNFAPKQIIYISCNPSTLARDLKEFASAYTIKDVQPIDLFPHTPHIETVCNMLRK